MGGLGVQSAVAVQPAASFSGWWRFAIEGLITLTIPPELTEDRGHVPLQALDRLCQALPAQCLLPRQWLVGKALPELPEPDWLSQKWWAAKIHARAGETLCSLHVDRDILSLQCPNYPSVGAWLRVIPSRAMGLELSAPTFQVLLKWWLGQEIVNNACSAEQQCPSGVPVLPVVRRPLL